MSVLNIRQMRDITGRLNRLRVIAAEQHKAIDDQIDAIRRSGEARKRYAEEWSGLVRLYGEQNAPQWLESIRGPKPKIEATT